MRSCRRRPRRNSTRSKLSRDRVGSSGPSQSFASQERHRTGTSFAFARSMGILRTLLGKDTTTDVLDLLEAQHKEVDELFARLEQGDGDPRALFTELADKLAAHAAAEEKVFYPS